VPRAQLDSWGGVPWAEGWPRRGPWKVTHTETTEPRWLAERRLRLRDVRCAGPLDTEGFDKVSSTASGGQEAQWANALGNNPNYKLETSATYLVKPGIQIPSTVTVVRGSALRQAIEQRFAQTLREAGVSTTVIDARTLTHQQVNTSIGRAGDTVMTPPLMRFLVRCFKR